METTVESGATAPPEPDRRRKGRGWNIAVGTLTLLLVALLVGADYYRAQAFRHTVAAMYDSRDVERIYSAIEKRSEGAAFLSDPVFESPEWSSYAAVSDGDEAYLRAYLNAGLYETAAKASWIPWVRQDLVDLVHEQVDLPAVTPATTPMTAGLGARAPYVVFVHADLACNSDDVGSYLAENPLQARELIGVRPIDRERSLAAAAAVEPQLMAAAARHICGYGQEG